MCVPPGSHVKIKPTDPWPGLEVGLKLFADLGARPFGKLFKLYVGAEVTKIDMNRELRYDYLDGAITGGDNQVFFSETDEDGRPATRIHQVSHYEPTSIPVRILMPLLYEYIHGNFVRSMHESFKQMIEAKYQNKKPKSLQTEPVK